MNSIYLMIMDIGHNNNSKYSLNIEFFISKFQTRLLSFKVVIIMLTYVQVFIPMFLSYHFSFNLVFDVKNNGVKQH